jgi:hypothetical protein
VGRPFRTVVGVIVTFALFLSGCGGGDKPSAKAADPAASSDGEPGSGGSSDGDVEVLDNGPEPREELRFSLEAGQEFRSRMTMDFGMDLSIDGEALPSTTLPAMEALIVTRIERVDDGVATFRFTYEEIGTVAAPGVDPEVARQYESGLQQLKGMSGTGSVDERGVAGEGSIDAAGVTDPNLKAQLESFTSQISNLTVPFPAEAVGVGARWKADRRAVLNGVTTDTSTTYTLRSREGSAYTLDIVQEVTAPTGPVNLPGLPQGSTAEIVSYQMDNAGDLAGDLDTLLPRQSSISGAGDITMQMVSAGQTSELVQRLTLGITIGDA